MDVITSSGPGTGYAATVEKAKALRSGAGDHPLALASGVSPENVAGFLPYVDAYYISLPRKSKLKNKLLANRIHEWDCRKANE